VNVYMVGSIRSARPQVATAKLEPGLRMTLAAFV
jgi:hypothetical protein